MREKAGQILSQLVAFWGKLSNVKRIALVLATTGVLVAALAISTFGPKEHLAYLFTELGADDAQGIVTKLKELKVPFKLDASGTAIQVPEEKVHELRLELAGLGLPRGGGVGFELFDKPRFGSTEFEQRIHHRRALEGELSRTIATIAGVQAVRVHLVLPERSVFAAQKERASASVVLKLRPGKSFGKNEIATVVHLVASAVPGLAEERISVVSADGLTLHRPRFDNAPSAALDREAQSEREQQIRHMTSALE
ncbi:MAG: flagellar basal-body MS-ring/collar protein FliF, partial [Myxococcales bacterium]